MEENRKPTCEETVPITEDYQRTIKKLFALSDAVGDLLAEVPEPDELEMIEHWEEIAGPSTPMPTVCAHLFGHSGPHEASAGDELRDHLIVWARWQDGGRPEVIIADYCDLLLGPEGLDDNCCMLPKYHQGPHHNNGVTW